MPNYLAAGVAPGSYQFQVTELDVSSNETAPSAPVAVAPSASCQIALTWTVVGSPTNQRVYCVDYLSGVPRYTYVATGSTAGSYTVTAIPFGTTGTPPVNAAAAMQPAYILPFSAIAGAAQYVQGQAQQFQVANNIWEHLYLGVFDLPPIPQLDSQANNNAGWLNWVLKLQARSGTNAAVISADYLALFPEEEPFLTARFSPNNLATRRNWIIETRRDGANAAYLTSQADGTVQGQCRVDGAFWLGPGYNVVQFLFDMAGGFADYGNAQVNVTFRYMPRYYDLGGVVGMP